MNINIPLNQLKDRVCKCGGFIFVSAMILKEVPPIYSPTGGYETLMQPAGFVCALCGTVIPLTPEGPVIDTITQDEETKDNTPKIVLAKS